MEVRLETLRKSEQVAYLLRNVYEQYGYQKFRMSKFEEYDFYTENRDFLEGNQILTFTDLSGKLMALKPDVTMSIVKNTHATKTQPEKLYYTESVYRASSEVKEYKEIFQIGVEHLGEITLYTQAEMVNLALKSLACIEESCMLDLSHMGILNGLMQSAALPFEVRRQVVGCIESKNAHELALLLAPLALEERIKQSLLTLTTLSGSLHETLAQVEPLLANDTMRQAYNELQSIAAAFKGDARLQCLRLDFSVTSASKYYNGLKMRGYVKSVPRAVLSGGRYDLLLTRMGKPHLQAIGFAVYFDEVERYLKAPASAGYDAVVLYDHTTDMHALHQMVESLTAKGQRVCAATSMPAHAGQAKLYLFTQGNLEELS